MLIQFTEQVVVGSQQIDDRGDGNDVCDGWTSGRTLSVRLLVSDRNLEHLGHSGPVLMNFSEGYLTGTN